MLPSCEALPTGACLRFNTVKYTPFQLWVFCIGCGLWVVTYIAVILHVRKEKFVAIPAVAVVANITWEWLWGFAFMPDMGKAIVWGYRI